MKTSGLTLLSFYLLIFLVVLSTHSHAMGETETDYILIPFPIYTPETKAAFILTALYFSKEIETGHVSTFMSFLAYSQLNQFRVMTMGQSNMADGLIHVSGGIGFADWPDKFFGIGTDNTEDDKEDFTSRSVSARLALQYRFNPRLMAGASSEFRYFSITDTEQGGRLDIDDVLGSQGGNVFGVGPLVTYDSRDETFFPRKGNLSQFSVMVFKDDRGDYDFQRYRMDLRHYMPVGESGVIAFQEYVNIVRGDIPFQYLSRIGDMGSFNLVRGYFSGLFIERDVAAFQVEYRTTVWKKVGAAVFGSAGVIGNDLLRGKDLAIKPAGGFGLRYRVGGEEPINLRLDFAIGDDSTGVYFNILESF